MSLLEVPGAQLYYETIGHGPLMVMIAGAGGAAEAFRMMADQLASEHTVLIYDRRGFSRSQLDGPQDYNVRLPTDAADVCRLIEFVRGAPATVFGGSSGALVALEVLTRHPSVVGTVVPFEPPAMRILPDGQRWIDFFFALYDRYRSEGVDEAMRAFRQETFAAADARSMATAPTNEYSMVNAEYWFEHELRQYPALELDLEALEAHRDRIILAVGRESYGHPACAVTIELSKRLDCELVELPGGHVGYESHPEEFARALLAAVG